MNNIGFNCDVCGKTVQGCTFVNGMKFCAKCYYETFGKDYSQIDIKINAQYTEHLAKENVQLKEQLAEKDKEIEELKEFYDNMLQNKLEVKCVSATEEKIKEIRKQVCDEIREKLKKQIIEEDISDCNTDYGDKCWLYAMEVDMTKILDQMEQKESKK